MPASTTSMSTRLGLIRKGSSASTSGRSSRHSDSGMTVEGARRQPLDDGGRRPSEDDDGRSIAGALNGGVVHVTAITSDVIRVRWSPDGRFRPRRSWAVMPPDEAYPPPPIERSTDDAGPARLATSSLVAEIDERGRFSLSTASGR